MGCQGRWGRWECWGGSGWQSGTEAVRSPAPLGSSGESESTERPPTLQVCWTDLSCSTRAIPKPPGLPVFHPTTRLLISSPLAATDAHLPNHSHTQ